MDEVIAALETYEDIDWAQASDLIVPVMPRVRPFPPGAPPPLQAMIEPSLVVGFGIDIGPAFITVTDELASHWKVHAVDILARAVANVHDRAALIEPSLIYHGEIDSVPTEWLQTGQSIGSTLVLAPTELRRLFGASPRLFITPMRDLIIGLPADCSRELALWLYVEIASGDPNCLGPTAYRFDGRRVVPELLGPLDLTIDAQAPLSSLLPA